MNTSKVLFKYIKTYRNFPTVMLKVRNSKQSVNAKFRDGLVGDISNRQAILVVLNHRYYNAGLGSNQQLELLKNEKFKYKGRDITIHGLLTNGDINGLFIYDQYSFLQVRGETVLDIGANIGDSAIYFAMKGANKVIALEPFPSILSIAERNILENNLKNQVMLIQGGYGSDSEVFTVDNESNVFSEVIPNYNGNVRVTFYSLKKLKALFNIDDAVLKMDCEGGEYSIVGEDDETLRTFKRIQIEYHHKGPKSISERLQRAGFDVKFTRSLVPNGLGYVYAIRK